MSDLSKKLYDEAMYWEGGRPSGFLMAAGDQAVKLERENANLRAELKRVKQELYDALSGDSVSPSLADESTLKIIEDWE